MIAEPENERFQELVTDIFDVLMALESEIVVYKAAQKSLTTQFFDGGAASAAFQHALESVRRAPSTRKALAAKYAAELARFRELPHLPIGPKMDVLRVFLKAVRSGDLRFYPSNDAPLKDAQ
jgi:hypothetical protein